MKHYNWLQVLGMLVAMLLLITLASCTDGQQPPDGNEEETLPPIENGVLVENLSEYTVVRRELGEQSEKNAATALARVMRESCGLGGIVTDYIEAVEKEILIGATNRPESEQAAAWAKTQVSEGDAWYYIGVTENKIVLTGSDALGAAAAVRYIMKIQEEELKTGAVTLPEQQVFVYQNNIPQLIVTNRGTAGEKSVFVAEINLGAAPYFVDNTGYEDVTDSLREALAILGKRGGGVVFLPAGIYRITDTLTLPQNVTLRGEYVDPDQGDCTKGTVLLVDAKKFPKANSVIVMNQGSLAQGLTVYYEGQTLSDPTAYAATFLSAEGQGSWEIRDCTLLNSYDGIHNATRPNGMVTVDNVKGTVLHTGYCMEQRADISIATDMVFSPKYWANAGEAFGAPAEADIRQYMKGNGSVGFYLGDCDRDTYENIVLDGFATGMYNREMTRAGLSGSYHNLQILDAVIGIEGHGIDTRYGLLISNATIEASDTAVINATPIESDFCIIHLLNSTVNGKTEGAVHIYQSEKGQKDTTLEIGSRMTALPGEKLFDLTAYGVDTTGKTDISVALQKALDDASAAGGGIVYLPAGRYLLAKPVTVSGNNVQILGCNGGTHTQSGALDTSSILLVTYGRDGSEDDTAAITVSGEGSGVTGLSVIYPENGVSHTAYETESPARYAYCIRVTGRDGYVNFVNMIAVSRAVHFKGATNFVCDRLLMTVWDNGIRATDCSGLISRIHTNGTYHTLGAACQTVLGEDWAYNGAEVVTKVLDAHIVRRLLLVKLENCANLRMSHVFHYGAYKYMQAVDSVVVILNGESSRLTGISFDLLGGCDLKVVNFMRPNPSVYLERMGENYIYLYNWGAAHYSNQRIIVFEP